MGLVYLPTFGIISLIFMANVGKHASPMAHGWYEFGCILGDSADSDLLQVLYCSICQGDLAKAGYFR